MTRGVGDEFSGVGEQFPGDLAIVAGVKRLSEVECGVCLAEQPGLAGAQDRDGLVVVGGDEAGDLPSTPPTTGVGLMCRRDPEVVLLLRLF